MIWIFIAFFLLLVVAAIILLPLFRPAAPATPDASVDHKLLALYTKRDQLYQAIREAKFDLDTGKLSPEDYDRQVTRLKRQAASVLKAIDKREASMVSPEWDEQIEAQVKSARSGRTMLRPAVVTSAVAATAGRARYCPQCGARMEADDRFCPACGARVS